MKNHILALVISLGFLNNVQNCNAQRTKDKMYESINAISPCIRRMNGTHQIGCSSTRTGSTGVVHYVETPADLDIILKSTNGLTYIPVIPTNLFKRPLADSLCSSGNIQGLLVYPTNGTLEEYSHEASCPNKQFNVDGTCKVEWNMGGTGLMQEDFEFPIFYVNDWVQLNSVRECFRKYNNFSFEDHPQRSLCALQLEGFMFAAVDTPTCIRRSMANLNMNPVKYCDPLGDQNVWASLFPVGNSPSSPPLQSNMKYIVVTARLDTTSLFHDLVPGASSPVTGLVTLLSTAQLLKRMLPNYNNYAKNVLFLLLNGESYDYIGSQRVVYDMDLKEFPTTPFKTDTESVDSIGLEDIELLIEISQITTVDTLYVHTLNDTNEISNFMAILTKNSKTGGPKVKEARDKILPPSSLQSFVRSRPSLPGLVLADHERAYKNKFYNSIYDNASNIDYNYNTSTGVQKFVGRVSEMLALSLFEAVTNNVYVGGEKPDENLVNELFHCYLENANCTVHHAIQRKQFRKAPMSLYVGVTIAPNILTSLIGLTLAWFTADTIGTGGCNSNLTSNVFKYFNMSESIDNLNETVCYRACMNFTYAVSPAFEIEDYDWSSGQYSSWSESVWRDFNVQLFLQPTRAHEVMTIAIGTATFAASILLVYFVNTKSRILFESDLVSPTDC